MLVLLSSHSLQTVFSQHLQTPLWTRKVYVGVALAMVRNPRTMLLLPYVPVSLSAIVTPGHVMSWTPNSSEHRMHLRILVTFLNSSLVSWSLAELRDLMAPHSSTLAWRVLWTEEPGRLQSMGSLRVGHD